MLALFDSYASPVSARIRRINSDGNLQTLAGVYGAGYDYNGNYLDGTTANICPNLGQMALHPIGYLTFTDETNHSVRILW